MKVLQNLLQSLQANAGVVLDIRPWPIHFRKLPFHYLINIVSFHATSLSWTCCLLLLKKIMYHLQAGSSWVSHNNPQYNKLAADILHCWKYSAHLLHQWQAAWVILQSSYHHSTQYIICNNKQYLQNYPNNTITFLPHFFFKLSFTGNSQ